MNAINTAHPQVTPAKTSLTVAHVLARLLERLEHSKVPVDPVQYRSIVTHLVNEFGELNAGATSPGEPLRALLDTHPAAAEVYENLNYSVAGLCRSPLDISVAAERLAKEAIKSAMRKSTEGPVNGKS
jgi:hypothetical protein